MNEDGFNDFTWIIYAAAFLLMLEIMFQLGRVGGLIEAVRRMQKMHAQHEPLEVKGKPL